MTGLLEDQSIESILAYLPLHVCNPRDFAGPEELTVVAVPHPDH